MNKTIILQPKGTRIPCEEGQTILSALEKNGFMMQNNCRAGACGECKLKVIKGKFDQGFILDMALSKTDRENGLGLMCMAKPIDHEVEIDFEVKSQLSKMYLPKENLPFIVLEKILVTTKICRLKLRSLTEPLKFWPGQYINVGSKENHIPYRSYSISNIPNSDGDLIIYVSKKENGVTSAWIHEKLQTGEVIHIDGPYGTFVGDPHKELPVLCLANGSGLAPIMSLANAAMLRGGFKYPATVIFSAKTQNDLFDLGIFKYLEKKFRNFRFIPTLTQENNPHYKHGRIPAILGELYPDLTYYSVYIAGSDEFIQDSIQKCKELNVKEENLYLESFGKS